MNDDMQHTSVSAEQMRAYAAENDIPIETSEAEARPYVVASPQLPVSQTVQAVPVEVYVFATKNGYDIHGTLPAGTLLNLGRNIVYAAAASPQSSEQVVDHSQDVGSNRDE